MIKVGVIGATGYAGQQVVWFLHNHPKVEIEFLCSHSYADVEFSKIYNNYTGFIKEICINIQEAEGRLQNIDVLFIALPHGKSFEISKKALEVGVKVIDLGADFRLNSPEVYSQWYGLENEGSELLKDSVYGLTEIYRDDVRNTKLLANPGCYTTASILALYPLLKEKLIDVDSIIIDAKSGVSGAGRNLSIPSLYAECNESIKAYGVGTHRHTPEIEQELSKAAGEEVVLTFTPHLVPMNRGILSTCYGKLKKNLTQEEVYNIYRNFYHGEYFIKVIDELPETKNVKGSNLCHIGIRVDTRTGRVIVISAIDNLIKGAAGQAIQNMNVMFGFKETEGINILPMQI